MTAPSVAVSVEAIRGWLDAHAPAAANALGPPADGMWLDRAERDLGQRLPDDLRDWWSRTDGAQESLPLIPWTFTPLTVAQALETRRTRIRIEREVWSARLDLDGLLRDGLRAPAGTAFGLWLPQWLPVACDPGTETLFVDLRPGDRHGAVMAFDRVDGALRPAEWNSIADMLDEISTRLTEADLDLPDDPWIDALRAWPVPGPDG